MSDILEAIDMQTRDIDDALAGDDYDVARIELRAAHNLLRKTHAEIERLRAALEQAGIDGRAKIAERDNALRQLAAVTAERDAAVGVLREAHNVLIEPYPTFADEDDETAQKLDEHQRVTELLESALTAAPHPATPPAAGAEATAETGDHAQEAVDYLYSAQGIWGDMQADVTGNWAHHMMLALESLMKHVGIDTEKGDK